MGKVSLVSKVKSHCFALDFFHSSHFCSTDYSLSFVLSMSLSVWLLPITISTGYSPTLREKNLWSNAPSLITLYSLIQIPYRLSIFPMTSFQFLFIHQFIAICLLAPLKLLQHLVKSK